MLLDLLKLKGKYNLNIKGVLHIGAHFGQEFSVYENIGVKNIVFFEPLPHTFEKLKENVGSKNGNVLLINSALGNMIGEIEMNVETANQGQSSSILEPHIHLKQYPHIIFNNKINVKITKLDTFIEEKEKYNFINIDVQGYELEVFKGGSEFLNHIDYIMTEVNKDEVYKNCPMIEDLDNFLKPYGFERVETTWDGITWGDAFYIKK
jgi:FkbM family methyltransferase